MKRIVSPLVGSGVRRAGLVVIVGLAACTALTPDDDPMGPAAQVVGVAPADDLGLVEFDPGACIEEELRAPFAAAHPDVGLVVRYDGAATLEQGEHVSLSAELVNRSEERSYMVVLPGDGSQAGWREPRTLVEARMEVAPDCWQPVPRRSVGRCGVYDANWADEVVKLAPGQRESIWAPSAGAFEWPAEGRVRVRAIYQYGAGTHDRSRDERSSRRGRVPVRMRGVEPFEIVSNEIEFTMTSPLRLEVGAIPNAASGGMMLREHVTVRLRNASSDGRAIRWPTAELLLFEVREGGTGIIRGNWEPGAEKPGLTLGPGEVVTLVGAGRINEELEFAILDSLEEPAQIRARLRPYADRRDVEIISAWVDLELD